MQKSFITNIFLVVLLNLLIKPLWIFGIDRTVQNIFDAEVYGIFYTMNSISFLFNILLDFGITNFNNREVSSNHNLIKGNYEKLNGIRIILALSYFAVCIVFSFIFGYDSEALVILLLLCINQFLMSMILFVRSNIAALHLFRTDSILSVIDRLLMLIFCSLFIFLPAFSNYFSIHVFILLQTAAYIITLSYAIKVISKYTTVKITFPDKTYIKSTLNKSAPFAILVLLMTIYTRTDMVMLERMLPDGAEQVSIYAASYRLIDAGNMIAFLFAGILYPKFTRMLHFKENIDNLFQIAFSFLMVFAISFTVFGYFFSDEIITSLYLKNIFESSDVLKWLSIAFTALAGIHIYGTLLTANGQLKVLNYIAIISIFVNVLLNLILIPILKAEACAISSLTALVISAILQGIYCKKYISLKYSGSFTFKLLSYIVLLIGFTYGYRYHEHNLNIVTHIVVFLFFSVTLALLSGFISPLQVFKFLIDEMKSEVKKIS